jgi:hypothetical protein
MKSMAAMARTHTAAGSITSRGKWLLGWSDDSKRWFAIMVISKWWWWAGGQFHWPHGEERATLEKPDMPYKTFFLTAAYSEIDRTAIH